MNWTTEKPTEPGWYWYEDEYYGPAPVYLAWTGFIKRPEARSLDVDMCCGDDQELIGTKVEELSGEWCAMQMYPTNSKEE